MTEADVFFLVGGIAAGIASAIRLADREWVEALLAFAVSVIALGLKLQP